MAYPQTYMGMKVVDTPFSIANGQVLMLPSTDRGAIPAENDKIKIEVAGFSVHDDAEKKESSLIWIFGFTSKIDQKIEKVKIEEIATGSAVAPMVQDDAPRLKGQTWSTHTPTEWP